VEVATAVHPYRSAASLTSRDLPGSA